MSKAQGLFITGTDTGVGKTQVTAILALALKKQGLRVGVMKPVESGCPVEHGQLQPQDSLFLRQISGCIAPQELVTPYILREPLAPAIAARHDGKIIDLQHIAHCYHELAQAHDIILVEGAGGLLVPLTEQENFLDLAVNLQLPILVVARNSLGTINHTALTVRIARQRYPVVGIVLNTLSPQPEDVSQTSNAAALQLWGGAPLLGQIPYIQKRTPQNLLAQSENLDLSAIQAQLSLSRREHREVHPS